MSRDPRVDAYIERKAEFARPILQHLRAAIHRACPEVVETLKWSSPAFLYKGEILASMAAFKAHAGFGFWRGGLVVEDSSKQTSAMGQFGRLTSIADLPDDATLQAMIRKAMELADAGVKPARTKIVKSAMAVPEDFRAALDGNPAASATFAAFSPSAQREYVEWVTEAKRADTRSSRLAQSITWLAEGKKRNWKYEKC